MAKSTQPLPPDRTSGPGRVGPRETRRVPAEPTVVRGPIQVEDGDVVISRERLPRLNPFANVVTPWRYRVHVSPEPPVKGHAYSSFQHAAFQAEDLATGRHARLIYVENHIPTVLSDYRR